MSKPAPVRISARALSDILKAEIESKLTAKFAKIKSR
ncbi:MAG: hypothetical protein JWO91_455 [Acidobacteriaceae bacterium]|nr:hypothetical protein [Acidobacteriaceae bacterium]